MNRSFCITAFYCATTLIHTTLVLAAENGPKASALLQGLLASESLTTMNSLSEELAEYAVDDAGVRRLIDSANSTTSEASRNLLWHAIRYTRSQVGRDFLCEVIPSAAVPMRIEWLQTLKNPAPYDIPILVAVYESAGRAASSDEASLEEIFVRFALGHWRDVLVTTWHSTTDAALYHSVGKHRQADCDAAQLRLLMYLVASGHDLATRIAAFEYRGHSWFRGFDQENRNRLAKQLLGSAKTPAERAQLVSVLRRQFKPTSFLHGAEPLEVKLAAISVLGELVAEDWRGNGGYDSLRSAYKELLPIAQDEDHPELSLAVSKMINSMETRYGEKAVK